jgi:hypothetical protein
MIASESKDWWRIEVSYKGMFDDEQKSRSRFVTWLLNCPGSLAKLVGRRVKHLQLTCDHEPVYTHNPSNQNIAEMAQQQVSGKKQQGNLSKAIKKSENQKILTMCQSCKCSIPTSRIHSRTSPRKSAMLSKKLKSTSMLRKLFIWRSPFAMVQVSVSSCSMRLYDHGVWPTTLVWTRHIAGCIQNTQQ